MELCMRNMLRVTKALADAPRLRILMLLQPGELCVCQIVEVLGLAPSTVSKHLSVLHAGGLVEVRKAGRWAYYRLPDGAQGRTVRPLLHWLQAHLRGDADVGRDRKALRAVLACDITAICRRQRKDG